jgi:hypothetical protein
MVRTLDEVLAAYPQFRVVWVRTGLAHLVGDSEVHLHRDLQHFPELVDECLRHEAGHAPHLGARDFYHDISNSWTWDLRQFVLNRPSAWLGFLPVRYHAKEWYLDPYLATVYTVIILILLWFFGPQAAVLVKGLLH